MRNVSLLNSRRRRSNVMLASVVTVVDSVRVLVPVPIIVLLVVVVVLVVVFAAAPAATVVAVLVIVVVVFLLTHHTLSVSHSKSPSHFHSRAGSSDDSGGSDGGGGGGGGGGRNGRGGHGRAGSGCRDGRHCRSRRPGSPQHPDVVVAAASHNVRINDPYYATVKMNNCKTLTGMTSKRDLRLNAKLNTSILRRGIGFPQVNPWKERSLLPVAAELCSRATVLAHLGETAHFTRQSLETHSSHEPHAIPV